MPDLVSKLKVKVESSASVQNGPCVYAKIGCDHPDHWYQTSNLYLEPSSYSTVRTTKWSEFHFKQLPCNFTAALLCHASMCEDPLAVDLTIEII